jgi:rhodanese-related sulfurtransferase
MLQLLKNIFGIKANIDFGVLISKGAVIIDVRTVREFQSGHLKYSKNIPLDKLVVNISKLNKTKPIIFCCATGARSRVATHIIKSKGFNEVYNGGRWTSLKKYEYQF